jgi:hypothetical protein
MQERVACLLVTIAKPAAELWRRRKPARQQLWGAVAL